MRNSHPPRHFGVLELYVGTFGVDHEPAFFFESADNVPAFHVCMNTHFESCPSRNGRKKPPSLGLRYCVATWVAGLFQPVPYYRSDRGLGLPGDARLDLLAGGIYQSIMIRTESIIRAMKKRVTNLTE